jgi:hypothetical protein
LVKELPTPLAVPEDALPTPPILIRGNTPPTYLLVDGLLRPIADAETFAHLGFHERDTVVGASLVSLWPRGEPITRLLQDDEGRAFLIENGTRREVLGASTLERLEPSVGSPSTVPTWLLAILPAGQAVPSAADATPGAMPPVRAERFVRSYSPTGGSPRLTDLYTVYTDGTRPSRLTYGRGNSESFGPAWSPDGLRIAFTHCAGGGSGSCAITLIDATGGEPQTLGEAMTHQAAWSPDGSQIAHWLSRESSIRVMDASGADAREVAKGRLPAWTPEGHLAFWAGEGPPYTLTILSAQGTTAAAVERVVVYDQRYHPWRTIQWTSDEDPLELEASRQ